MFEWLTWGFVMGVKVFGAAAGLILALVFVFLFSLLALVGVLELIDRVLAWALQRFSK